MFLSHLLTTILLYCSQRVIQKKSVYKKKSGVDKLIHKHDCSCSFAPHLRFPAEGVKVLSYWRGLNSQSSSWIKNVWETPCTGHKDVTQRAWQLKRQYCPDLRTNDANLVFDDTSSVISIWLRKSLFKRKRISIQKNQIINFTTCPRRECSQSNFIYLFSKKSWKSAWPSAVVVSNNAPTACCFIVLHDVAKRRVPTE